MGNRAGMIPRRLWNDFLRMLFPECCPVCHAPLVDGEELLCLDCLSKLPRTGYHLTGESPLTRKLISLHAPIEKAAAYFFYKNENPYSRMIRDAKYNSRPDINRILSKHFAMELRPYGFFDGIDLIIPVPIHWTKQLKRGYNQCDYIAAGISDVTGIPTAHNLRASHGHKTQTKKSGNERLRRNLSQIFSVDSADELSGKHILLVDDIITTGSTIIACAESLHAAVKGIRISILSLATTKLA